MGSSRKLAYDAKYRMAHLEEKRKYLAAYRAANRETLLIKKAEWYRANREAQIASMAKRYAANRAERIAQVAAYRIAFPDKVRATKAVYYEANKDKIKAGGVEYRRRNPDKVRATARNKYARRRGAEGTHSLADERAQYDRQKGRCFWCCKPMGKKYHVDHVIPIVKGGTNHASNIVIACPRCNLSKQSKMPSEFAGRLL